MKQLRVGFLSLMVLLYGIPWTTTAQSAPESFTLPRGVAGELYRVNIESVLRETYHLRLETDAGRSIFRWATVSGEIPPGLVMRPNGTIVGIPRAPRDEAYSFQLKVLDVALPRGEALILNFTILVSGPRIRLAHITTPKLVRTDKLDQMTQPLEEQSRIPNANKESGFPATPEASSKTSLKPPAANPTTDQVYASMLKNSASNDTAPLVADYSPCDPKTAPSPSTTPGANVIQIDARTGTPVYERLRFKKNEKVTVVIDNKNPYLYTYKYTSTAKDVKETAFGTLLPLFGGIVGDILSPGDAPKPAASPAATPGLNLLNIEPGKKNPCEDAHDAINSLANEMDSAARNADTLVGALRALKNQREQLKKAYDTDLKQLKDGNKTRGALFCASKDFLRHTDGVIKEQDLDAASKANEDLDAMAKSFGPRIDLITASYPKECLDLQYLYRARIFAEGLVAVAAKNSELLKNINSTLDTVKKTRDSVETVLAAPNSFFEQHLEGDFETTKDVEIKVELTPVGEGVAAAGPYKLNLKFGGAPFFSLSGGLIFSPLRKVEFDRIQGFERDQQGNLVLVNGKPNLTTVVGLKETSSSRITPAIFLHGRIREWNNRVVDGLHLSLGITAKNDNKGTDPEFLLGPSLSMLERKMFFTFGAYAGRQQKLTGGLFEGFAVPSTVTDLPIQKNYRWNFGFALSYELPVNKK